RIDEDHGASPGRSGGAADKKSTAGIDRSGHAHAAAARGRFAQSNRAGHVGVRAGKHIETSAAGDADPQRAGIYGRTETLNVARAKDSRTRAQQDGARL